MRALVCILSTVCTIAISPLLTLAQTANWAVVLYDHGANALVMLSSSETEVMALPNIGYQPRLFEPNPLWYINFYHGVMVSDDYRYFVALTPDENEYNRTVTIVDLDTQETRIVASPPLSDDEIFVTYSYGVFDPQMMAVALPFVSHNITSGFGCCDSGGIAVIELSTGRIAHILDVDETYNQSTAWVDNWTSDGIWFYPKCSACTPPLLYSYLIWNPHTNAISPANVFTDRQYLERLTATGEVLYSESHPDFPLGGSVYPPHLNTVVLYQPDELPTEVSGRVVYYDIDNLSFDKRAHWIMNGTTFVVTNDLHHNVVVFRNGTTFTFDYVDIEYFLTMTSEGWITIDRATNQIRHYVVFDNQITQEVLYQAEGEIEVANVRLPAGFSELPPFAIDIMPLDVEFCPGALPTQFKSGDWAEIVTDHEEVVISRLIVGDVEFDEVDWDNLEALPLGAYVRVIDGPACMSNAGYLKVEYQGTVGWILEVYQMHYSLVPTTALPEQ